MAKLSEIDMARKLHGQGQKVKKNAQGNYVVASTDDSGVLSYHPVAEAYQNQYKPVIADPIPGNIRATIAKEKQAEQALAEAERDFNNDWRRTMKKDAADMSLPEATLIHAGREGSKLKEGVANISDLISYGTLGKLHPKIGDYYFNKMQRREKEQESADEAFEPFKAQTTLSEIGGMLPYLGTNIFSQPIAKAYQGLGKEMSKRGVDAIDKVIPKLAKGDDPIDIAYQGLKNKTSRVNPLGRQNPSEIASDLTLGGAEYGAHYDSTPVEGMIDSAMGGYLGRKIAPRYERVPTFLDPAQQETLKFWRGKGLYTKPGERTGIPKLQELESKFIDSDEYSGLEFFTNKANEKTIRDQAAYAAGMPPELLEGSSARGLNEHLDFLKNTKNDLEAGTTVSFGEEQLAPIRSKLGYLDEPDLKAVERQIEKLSDPKFRNESGEILGEHYNELRMTLKSLAEQAYNGKNNRLGEIYKGLYKGLDDGLEKSMANKMGPEFVNSWKDFREQKAMTELLINQGMDTHGKVDVSKLGSYLANTDKRRMVLDDAPDRVSRLHHIAKLGDVYKKQETRGLGSAKIVERDWSGDEIKSKDFTLSDIGGQDVTPTDKQRRDYLKYISGTKIDNPLTRLPRGSVPLAARAYGVGTGDYSDPILLGVDLASGAKDFADEVVDSPTMQYIMDKAYSAKDWTSDLMHKLTQETKKRNRQ